jgi:hypothetical protein
MKKTLKFFAILLVVFLSGCAALKSKGGIGKTVVEDNFEPKLESVLVVSKVSEYDRSFSDNVAPFFRKHFSEDLTNKGVKNLVLEDYVDGKFTQDVLKKMASQGGYEYLMIINFSSITRIGRSNSMQHALIYARMTDVNKSKSSWIGTFYWERGLRDYESSDNAGKVLAEIIMSGLEENYKFDGNNNNKK